MSIIHDKSSRSFNVAVAEALKKRGLQLENVCNVEDAVEKRLLTEYGAIFVAHSSVAVPPVCLFAKPDEVVKFQTQIEIMSAEIGDTRIELQAAAMRALLAARAQALTKENLDITPRGGAEAARRSFEDTVRLWFSRVEPALAYWHEERRAISQADVVELRAMPLRDQIAVVLELETREIFFSKDFSKSILFSVAAPGASQHLSMLAFDASEFYDARVRAILADHGWFRTVRHDLPHFTFLGRKESELPGFGLKRIETEFGEFWIPNADDIEA